MGRKVKDVLLFCNDVVQRQPHNLDQLIKLLNLDSEDLLTNENLQIITSLLKDHYDLLVRFGTIFLPDNYKLQPWKDMMDNRVYCMLIKGDAMYKLTSLEIEQQQFNAIEASKRHEEEERRRKMKRKFTSSSSSSSSSAREITTDHSHTMLSSRIVTCETKHKTKNPPPTTTNMTTTTTTTLESMETNDSNHNDGDNEINNNNTQKTEDDNDPHKPVSTGDDTNGLEHTLKTSPVPPLSALHWGSRSRPTARKYSLAIPYLNALSSDQLHEFLKHKNMTPGIADMNTFTEKFHDEEVDIQDDDTSLTKEDMVQIIIKYCKLTTSSPYEVLPTFLKKK